MDKLTGAAPCKQGTPPRILRDHAFFRRPDHVPDRVARTSRSGSGGGDHGLMRSRSRRPGAGPRCDPWPWGPRHGRFHRKLRRVGALPSLHRPRASLHKPRNRYSDGSVAYSGFILPPLPVLPGTTQAPSPRLTGRHPESVRQSGCRPCVKGLTLDRRHAWTPLDSWPGSPGWLQMWDVKDGLHGVTDYQPRPGIVIGRDCFWPRSRERANASAGRTGVQQQRQGIQEP